MQYSTWRVVGVVANEMLPEPALPDVALAAPLADNTQPFLFRQSSCKPGLDQAPSCGEVGVARRQRPDGMDVVGKDGTSINLERIVPARAGDRVAI